MGVFPIYKWRQTALLFAMAAILFLSGAYAGEEMDDAAAEARWKAAQAALANGEADKAYGLFGVLLEQWPESPVLRLGRARSAALSGRNSEAIALYEHLLVKFPENERLRDEARKAGGFMAARAGGREAGQAKEPPRTQMRGALRTGVLYDSNANSGLASERFDYGPFILNIPGSGKKESAAVLVGGNFDLVRRIGNKTPWAVVLDIGLQWRGNENAGLQKIKRREWQWGRVGVGIRHTTQRNLFEIRAKGDVFDYHFEDSVFAGGLEMRNIFAVTKRFHLVSQVNGEWRHYEISQYRNGLYCGLGQYFRLLSENGNHAVTLGGRVFNGDAQVDRFDYYGAEASLRLSLRVAEKLRASPFASYLYERYRGRATVLDADRRRDKRFRVGMDLQYRLRDNLDVELNYYYVKNNSSSHFNKYTQHVVGMCLTKTF